MKLNTRKLVLSALFLALAILLPFITGQIPTFGKMLTPMHFPVILGSLVLGPVYGFLIGVIAPLLRQLLFGMPPFPMSVMMAFELATYGVLSGLLYVKLGNLITKDVTKVYVSIIISMIIGRVVFALAALSLTGASSFMVVFFGTFTGSFVGIVLQLLIIPILYFRIKDRK